MDFARSIACASLVLVLGCGGGGGSSMADLSMGGAQQDLTGVPPGADLTAAVSPDLATAGGGTQSATVNLFCTMKDPHRIACKDSGITGVAITLKDQVSGATQTTTLPCKPDDSFVEGEVARPSMTGPFTVKGVTQGTLTIPSDEFKDIGPMAGISFTIYICPQDMM